MNLLLLEANELDAAGRCRLEDHRARHLLDVLHVSAGSRLRAGVVGGPTGEAVVEKADRRSVTLCWTATGSPPARPDIDLLLALPRPKVMKRLWAQLAALRVGRIVLTNAEKVERCYFDTHVLAPSCYGPLQREGLSQAQHTWLPEVLIRRRFRPLVEDELDRLFGTAFRILAEPAPRCTLPEVVASRTAARLVLAVGPEGGWTPFETDLLKERGFVPASLGPCTLRTDTACVALLGALGISLGNPAGQPVMTHPGRDKS